MKYHKTNCAPPRQQPHCIYCSFPVVLSHLLSNWPLLAPLLWDFALWRSGSALWPVQRSELKVHSATRVTSAHLTLIAIGYSQTNEGKVASKVLQIPPPVRWMKALNRSLWRQFCVTFLRVILYALRYGGWIQSYIDETACHCEKEITRYNPKRSWDLMKQRPNIVISL